jgi:hypothetical protein
MIPECKNKCGNRTDTKNGICRTCTGTSYMPPSKSDVHLTPKRVYDIIKDTWNVNKEDMFDPCPLNPQFDGLSIEWAKYNYINPPYSKPLFENFIYKAISESKKGKTSFLLLPCKTDQQFFHDLHYWYDDIVWIKGRLKFTNNKWSATQPHFLIRIKGIMQYKGYIESKRDKEIE